ncbi:MAG: alpha/beta hydrolase [Nocardioidaceae bacterium]|nr:alpha/beta hydrolase [Nocardioidaceae bacterium]
MTFLQENHLLTFRNSGEPVNDAVSDYKRLKADTARLVAANNSTLGFPEAALTDPDQAKEFMQRTRALVFIGTDVEPVGRCFEEAISEHVKVRVYVPSGEGPFPVVVYFHGGGWVSGDLDMHDRTCRRITNLARCAVVNVDYRLAPEHPFPAPLSDAYAATLWATEHAHEFSGDPSRLIIAGSSAGGNLAAAVALRARDEDGPRIALQVLIYPVLDSTMDYESFEQYSDGFLLSRSQMRWYWDQYVPDLAQRGNPLVSPMHATSLSGLPPAYVLTAECDPLRDEGEAYASRLQTEGVDASHVRYKGQIHAFLNMFGLIADADLAVAELCRFIVERTSPDGDRDAIYETRESA